MIFRDREGGNELVATNPISVSEVGSLWQTYQEKTLIMRFLEYFIEKADDPEARNILGGLWQELDFYVKELENIFTEQGMVKPVGFTTEDVNLDAPKLFDNGFDIMFVRILKEKYMEGFKLIGNKRPLNDLEIGIIHHNLEVNNIGMQLITGFAQCAQNKEVKQYFIQGKDLAKKQVKVMEDLLREEDIQLSAISGATVTPSTVPPFSDKLMMHCIYILNGFGLVGAGTGGFFSLRNDLAMKTLLLAKDVYFYAQEGIEIKIKNGWFEEPPQ